MRTQLFTLLSALLVAFTGQAQTLDANVNLLGFSGGRPTVGIEYAVGPAFGVELTLNPTLGRKLSINETDWSGNGFGAGLQAKYYFSNDEGIDRVYLAAYSRYMVVNNEVQNPEEVNSSDFKRNRLGVGLALGYKYVTNFGLFFEAAAGAGANVVNKFTYDDGSNNEENGLLDQLTGIDLYGRLSIGYRILR